MTDPWEMIVSLNGPAAIDADEVRRALGVLLDPGGYHELRGLPMPGSRAVQSRIASAVNLDAAVQAAGEIGQGIGTYYTLNLVRADLGDRAAKVSDITSRRWILIDCDRSKAAEPNAMATAAEKTAAQELASRVASYLIERGFPLPVIIDSGNGQHLLYLVDLPANEDTRVLVRNLLRALAGMFDAPDGPTIGAECHNASRISKLPGTWVRKGASTAERPWRMAHLMFVPDPLQTVSRELIEAVSGIAATEEPPAVPIPDPWEMIVQGGHDRITAYVKAAVDKETVRVLLATEGNRNGTLNEAAFALGQFVGAHLLSRDEVVQDLTRAAFGCGLDRDPGCGERGIAATIASGMEAGILQPRTIPLSVTRNGKPAATLLPAKLTIGLDEVVEEDVDWIYENVIAIGFISIFAGQTSQGKSFVVCDLIARLTRGDCFPFSTDRRPPSHVLMISEDPLEQMLAPRLNAMGAVQTSVRFMTWEAMAQYTIADTEMLDRAYLECRQPILLVIDPPQNFLGRTDEHKNAEVRMVLMRVVAWLQKRLAACILIMHVNKQIGKGLAALDRIMGSVAWATTPRIAIGFTDNPDVKEEHLMAGIKNNLGPKAQAISYRIDKLPDNPKRARIEWVSVLDITADEAMNRDWRKPVGIEAVEWITDRFREQREWESSELRRLAQDAGVSLRAIFKGDEVKALPIRKRPRIDAHGNRVWTWLAKGDWPPKREANREGDDEE